MTCLCFTLKELILTNTVSIQWTRIWMTVYQIWKALFNVLLKLISSTVHISYLSSSCFKNKRPTLLSKSPHSSHEYSSTCALSLTSVKGTWLLVKGATLKTRTRELITSQARQLQSGAYEAPPCLQGSTAFFFKALFAFCSLQPLNSTQKKSLFLPFLFSFHCLRLGCFLTVDSVSVY